MIITVIETAKKLLKKDYDIATVDSDFFKSNNVIYLSTAKVAELCRIGHHHFCNVYVTPLLDSGVRRTHLGRQKFYCLSEVLTRINKSIEKRVSVLKICKLMTLE